MITYWNDLQNLHDIQNQLIVQENSYSDKDIEDFKESISYFIQDFLDNNIKLYKEYNFENIICEYLYQTISETYFELLNQLDSEFDLEYNILDAINIYFYKNKSFRSYSGTGIIEKNDKTGCFFTFI